MSVFQLTPPPLRLCVSSRAEAHAAARLLGATAMLSALDPKQEIQRPPSVPEGRHLLLQFEDTDDAGRRHAPRKRHVAAALRFADSLGPTDALLVHCQAGISRSTALAYVLLAMAYGPGREAEALAALEAVRPVLLPNLLVVSHGAEILKRPEVLAAAQAFVSKAWGHV